MIPPHDSGDVITSVIPMTKNYKIQAYFDLEAENIIAENIKTEWDLGFECSDTGWHIILNTSKFMWAGNTMQHDFAQSIDTSGIEWKFDNSEGDPDSTAIGSWFEIDGHDTSYTQQVYIIDRGYNLQGNKVGLIKIIFQYVSDSVYQIGFGDLNAINPTYFTIMKNNLVNYVFFSFDDDGSQLNLEPDKDLWELWFTQYTTILFTNAGDEYPYLVTGVLINKLQGIEVARDTLLNFNNITLNVAEGMTYNDSFDIIGYDWKEVVGDVQSGNVSYIVRSNVNYLIRTKEDYYYKLRFIDFYSEEGEKGYPTFEFQLL